MFSFDAEYVDAAKFGAENKLDVPFLIPIEDRILNDEKRKQISELFIHYSGIPAESWERRITGQCVAVHFLLMDKITNILGSRPALTLGWVEAGGREFYRFGQQEVSRWLKEGNGSLTDAKLHMWLTLASMEIIDFTFVPSYIVVNKIPTNEIGFDCGHWSEFSDNRKHHPVVVGNDIVERLGLMGIAIGVF